MMDEDRDQIAARYVLGLARGDERTSIEHDLAHDPDLKAKVELLEQRFVPLDLAAAQDAPPPDLFAAIMSDIGAAQDVLPDTTTVRAAAAQWVETAPGVSVRILHDDLVTHRRSKLVRLQPGAILAPHAHPNCDEACFVIEGDLRFGDLHLYAGDFHLGHMSGEHPASVSTGGCLLHITTSL
jgi:mannose-6-phosphate isomerase-like protein (cupin superfamily)